MLFCTALMLYKRANKMFQVLVCRDKAWLRQGIPCLYTIHINKPIIDSSSPYYALFASLWCGFYIRLR